MGVFQDRLKQKRDMAGGRVRQSIIRTLDPFLKPAVGERLLDIGLKTISLPSTLVGGAAREAERTLEHLPTGRLSNVGAGFAALGRGAAQELAKIGNPDSPMVGVFDVLNQKAKTPIEGGLAIALDVLVGAGVEVGLLRNLGKLGLFGKRFPTQVIAETKSIKIDDVKNLYTPRFGAPQPLPPLGDFHGAPETFFDGIKRGLSSVDANVRVMGKSGNELIERLNRLSFEAERSFGEDAYRLREYKKVLSPAEQLNFVDVLEGTATPQNELVQKLVAMERQELNTLADQAVRAGVEVMTDAGRQPFVPRKNYFPRIYGEEFIKSISTVDGKGKLAQQLVNDGTAQTIAEADDLIDTLRRGRVETRFGHLQLPRKSDLPGYEKTIDALEKYYKGARFKLAEISEFGNRDQIAKQLLKNIELEGGDRYYAKEVWRRAVGLENFSNRQTTKNIARALANFETITGIANPLTAVLNSTQILSIPLRANIRSLITGLKVAAGPGAREYAVRAGALMNAFRQEMLSSGMDLSNLTVKALRASGFTASEEFNRIVATQAGKAFARENFAKLSKTISGGGKIDGSQYYKALDRLNLDLPQAIRRGYLTEDDLLRAGKTISDETQLRGRVIDVPLWASSPEGKLVFQFKTFIFGHSRLLRKAVKDNPANLIYILASPGVGGEFAQDIRTLLKGQNLFGKARPMGVERLVDNVAALGGFGLFYDLWQSSVYGQTLGFIAGPIAQDVGNLVNDLSTMLRGNPIPMLKRGLGKIPLVGRTLSGIAFPPR